MYLNSGVAVLTEISVRGYPIKRLAQLITITGPSSEVSGRAPDPALKCRLARLRVVQPGRVGEDAGPDYSRAGWVRMLVLITAGQSG